MTDDARRAWLHLANLQFSARLTTHLLERFQNDPQAVLFIHQNVEMSVVALFFGVRKLHRVCISISSCSHGAVRRLNHAYQNEKRPTGAWLQQTLMGTGRALVWP